MANFSKGVDQPCSTSLFSLNEVMVESHSSWSLSIGKGDDCGTGKDSAGSDLTRLALAHVGRAIAKPR